MGNVGDVIYTISTADLRQSYPFKDEPILKGFCEVNKTIINSYTDTENLFYVVYVKYDTT